MPSMWYLLAFLLTLSSFSVAQSTCSAKSPCPEGCCSKYGQCGYGPSYCAADSCINSCDAKSQCDPDGWGSQYASLSTCPLNVCCSKSGFCGTTSLFCGNETVTQPACSGTSSTGRTIGYYEGWSTSRSCDKMYPEEIDAAAFTHLNYGFALIDPVSFVMAPASASDPALYPRLAGLKSNNAGLKVWISIGGWSMNDPDQPTATTFSKLVASQSTQASFFKSLLSFLATFALDGVDIDWEYPGAADRSGTSADYANYVSFLQNLKATLAASGHAYGLSITLPASYWYLQHFDIVKLEPIVDWFNFMTYDLHGTWDATDSWVGPIVQAHPNLTEIDQAMQLLWRNNISPSKVNLGLGFYGRSFELGDPSCTAAGCPFSSGGNPGPCTATAGMLSYAEISRIIAAGGVTVTTDDVAAVEIATWGGNQWVSYDSVQTFQQKIDWANDHCLGGTMVWAVSLDTQNGTAANSLSKSTNRTALSERSVSKSSAPVGCSITDCSSKPTCPLGQSAVQQTNGDVQNVDLPGCKKGQYRTYCCASNDLPSCHWRGSAKLCVDNKCGQDEIELAAVKSNCWFNHKTLCCSKSLLQIEDGKCGWQGGCTLSSTCSDGSKPLYTSQYLGGGHCWVGSNKYCCPQPPPYTNCRTISGPLAPMKCGGTCRSNEVNLFNDPGQCLIGSVAVCCTMVIAPDDPTVASFTQAMTEFITAPTCSVADTELATRGELAIRGELSATPLSSRGLPSQGRGQFLTLLVLSMVGQSKYSQEFQAVWDKLIGNPYNFHQQDFQALFKLYPEDDPVDLANFVLCDILHAQQTLRDNIEVDDLCTLYSASNSTAGTLALSKKSTQLPKRIFGWGAENLGTGSNPWPYIGAFMQAVRENRVPLLYIRQLTTPSMPGDLNLEVVYDLRLNPELQQIPGEDIFGVFHFHTQGLTESGLPQIEAFVAFHAQYVVQRYGVWHIDGGDRDDANERTTVLNCHTNLYEDLEDEPIVYVWVPGRAGNSPYDSPAAEAIWYFGEYMREARILDPSVYHFTADQANGRALMTWNFETDSWDYNGLRESDLFSPGGGDDVPDMSPDAGWPQPPPS